MQNHSRESSPAQPAARATAMTSAAECRKYAEECVRLARSAANAKLKGHMLSMARTWNALAAQIERMEAMLKEPAPEGR